MGIQKRQPYVGVGGHVSLSKHTKRFFEVLSYNWVIFPLTATTTFLGETLAIHGCQLNRNQYLIHIALYGISTWTGIYNLFVQPEVLWTPDCTILTLVYLPFLLAQLPPYSILWGLCLPIRPFAYAKSPKKRSCRRLNVCLATKGTNIQTVINSVRPWKNCKHFHNISFYVVLNSAQDFFKETLPSFVNIVRVPDSFQPGHAKYKGRALEWCRLNWELTENDWVLHLDEETEIDEYLVKTCFDFIERGTEDVGMGTIYYTSNNYWKNAFLTTAEIFRVSEDFGRFQLPVRLFNRPLFGWMHGSFILINGAVENKITWDTGCLAEDFWFAFHAARQGVKFGWIHAIAREQPPTSISDLIRQRRRWYSGIMSIDSWSVKLALAVSMLGPLVYASLNMIIFLYNWRFSVSHWFFVWTLWNIAVDMHGLIVGSLLQDLHLYSTPLATMILHIILTLVWAPLVQVLHSIIFVSALIWPTTHFVVIRKV